MKRSQKERMKSMEALCAEWHCDPEKLITELNAAAGGYSGRMRYMLLVAARLIADYRFEADHHFRSATAIELLKAANLPLQISERTEDVTQARTLNLKMPGVQS